MQDSKPNNKDEFDFSFDPKSLPAFPDDVRIQEEMQRYPEADIQVSLERKFTLDTPIDELPTYISRLNRPQQEAVLTQEGPLLVLAGAGSGKTSMLTTRIAHLVRCGVQPWQILAVTFTNKAAHEMRERVGSILGEGVERPRDIGTFHSICAKILRREAAALPFTKPFVVYDDSDQLSLLKSIVKSLGIDDKMYSPKSFQWAINRLKCDGDEPVDATAASRGIERKLPEVYRAYQRALIENNAVDFGEMIVLTYRLLRDHPEIRKKYQRRYKFILVDEYQDTNRSQYLLLSILASPEQGGHGNICVVGDEDQSIYGWRGADIRNILDFERDYPGAAIIKLEQNYRSTKTIVEAASAVIENNSQRKRKKLWTDSVEGVPIVRMQCSDDRMEAEKVIREIQFQIQEYPEYSLRDFAIFYRTHAQSRLFEEYLRLAKMPYQVFGGLKFFDRKEVKDVLAYLKLILNPSDSVSLKRIINVPARGIGKTTIDKLESAWNQQGSLWDFLVNETLSGTIFAGRTLKKLQEFRGMMEGFSNQARHVPLSELFHKILFETKYVEELKTEGTDEAEERIANLEEFDSMIAEFEEREASLPIPLRLQTFLEQTALAESPETDGMVDSVQMMTFHACKGLEFPIVFMVGMEEGLFPSVREGSVDEKIEIEEERRLCYVGMTRAREKLYMSHAEFRRVWGDLLYQYPARFFEEIPESKMLTRNLKRNT